MTIDPQKTSIMARLNTVAKERSAPVASVLTEFFIERAVARLTATLFDHLIFKGGYVSRKVYASPRYTVDLDAVLRGLPREQATAAAKAALEAPSSDGVWFRFEAERALATQQDYGGVRLIFRAGVGAAPADVRRMQQIFLDIGIGDPVEPLHVTSPATLGGEPLSWLVYPAETICAEKLHAIVRLGDLNSRSKDLFDLYLLLPKTEPPRLREALTKTFAFRGDPLPKSLVEVILGLNLVVLQRGWMSAVRDLDIQLDFAAATAAIVEWLTSAGL